MRLRKIENNITS